jgi:hypothetical protein
MRTAEKTREYLEARHRRELVNDSGIAEDVVAERVIFTSSNELDGKS